MENSTQFLFLDYNIADYNATLPLRDVWLLVLMIVSAQSISSVVRVGTVRALEAVNVSHMMIVRYRGYISVTRMQQHLHSYRQDRITLSQAELW